MLFRSSLTVSIKSWHYMHLFILHMRNDGFRQLLAYVFGKLKDSNLLGIKTEAEKMLMLAALNLVECIAETAPRLPE